MSTMKKHYTLSNGVEIPSIGFGTWQVQEGRETFDVVTYALEAGYRHIDTAQGYGNEEGVGKAVKQSGLKRGDLFITSKLVNRVRGYEETRRAIEESLEKLGTDYMDLFLVHWPVPAGFAATWQTSNADSWRAMEEAHEEGKIRALGISNFRKKHIDELLKTAKVVPVVNQIRLCPGDVLQETVDYSRKQGMLLQAYSPLGTGKLFDVPEILDIAKRNKRTPAQVALRWSLQMGFNPLPKSITPERIRENLQVYDFELTQGDMDQINALDGVMGKSPAPDHITW